MIKLDKKEFLVKLRDLLKSQMLGVIATDMSGFPHASLVAYSSTDDLKYLIFATSKNTKKFQNLMRNSNVSLLIDNRENNPSDFNNAITVTAVGVAKKIQKNIDYFKDLFIKRHPNLGDFINASDCALLKIKVDKYQFVSNFQNVKYINTNDKIFEKFFEIKQNDS